jgi:hypothetical protein
MHLFASKKNLHGATARNQESWLVGKPSIQAVKLYGTTLTVKPPRDLRCQSTRYQSLCKHCHLNP